MGQFWMPITTESGSILHADSQSDQYSSVLFLCGQGFGGKSLVFRTVFLPCLTITLYLCLMCQGVIGVLINLTPAHGSSLVSAANTGY